MSNRFIDIEKLQALLVEKKRIENEISSFNPNHCRDCGDTRPKHGFYPLWGMAVGEDIYQSSGFICNRCALTDKEYQERFNESKENIKTKNHV